MKNNFSLNNDQNNIPTDQTNMSNTPMLPKWGQSMQSYLTIAKPFLHKKHKIKGRIMIKVMTYV